MAKSKFRKALERGFDKHGENAMEVAWIQEPLQMLKMCASLEVRQLKYEGVAAGKTDEQLAAMDAVLAWAAEAQAPKALLPAPQPGGIRVIGVPHGKEAAHR